jgi:AraC-like DNA-binding protein
LFSHPGLPTLHDPEGGLVKVENASIDALSIGRVTSSGHDVALSEDTRFALLLPLAGSISTETAGTTLKSFGDALLLPPGARRTRVEAPSASSFIGAAVIAPPEALHAAAIKLDEPAALTDPSRARARRLRSRSASERTLAALARTLLSEIDSSSAILTPEAWRRGWVSLISFGMVRILDENRRASVGVDAASSQDRRRVKLAEDLMRSSFFEALTLDELAAAAGCSVRSLSLAFRRVRELAPYAALTAIRLAEARSRLASTERPETISRVALDCGFTHLGRFARQYRETYGEMPSETLRARRG